jgi:hypothetical protein
MSRPVDILRARLKAAEGERLLPYDDATGVTVKAPKGKITWGRGFNLEQCGSPGLFDVMETYLLGEIERQLVVFPWYTATVTGDARRSVLLEIAYNAGVGGLLRFGRMLTAIGACDWTRAAAECAVADPKLNLSRYAPLRALILAGG